MRLVKLAIIAGLAALSWILPVFRLPNPTGPFPVGTVLLHLPELDGLALQVWYPAAPAPGAAHAPYLSSGGGLEQWLFNQVRTAAFLAPDMAPGASRFPVLVYVHSWGGQRTENTALMQELASYGFVIAACDQPVGMVRGVDLSTPMNFSTTAARDHTLRVIAVKLQVQVDLASRVLDILGRIDANPKSRFADRLDLDRAGILGFSFGGATAAAAPLHDPRFRAALNMDGLTFGDAVRYGTPWPYLEMSDDTHAPTAAELPTIDPAMRVLAEILAEDAAHTMANLARNGGIFARIRNSRHPNFSDYPVLVPLRRFNGAGPVDPGVAAHVIQTVSVGFFRSALDGAPFPDAAATPEAEIMRWPPRTTASPRSIATRRAIRAAVLQ
jgi:dienelactone hydrolase